MTSKSRRSFLEKHEFDPNEMSCKTIIGLRVLQRFWWKIINGGGKKAEFSAINGPSFMPLRKTDECDVRLYDTSHKITK